MELCLTIFSQERHEFNCATTLFPTLTFWFWQPIWLSYTISFGIYEIAQLELNELDLDHQTINSQATITKGRRDQETCIGWQVDHSLEGEKRS